MSASATQGGHNDNYQMIKLKCKTKPTKVM